MSIRALTANTPSYSLAVSALYLGRTDEAMEHAMRSVERFDAIGPVWIRFPDMEALYAHPQYPELRRRIEG